MRNMRPLGVYFIIMFTIAVCVLVSIAMPAHASKARELTAACKDNPQHQVCVDLAAKKAKAKARADAKLQAQIDAVLGK